MAAVEAVGKHSWRPLLVACMELLLAAEAELEATHGEQSGSVALLALPAARLIKRELAARRLAAYGAQLAGRLLRSSLLA